MDEIRAGSARSGREPPGPEPIFLQTSMTFGAHSCMKVAVVA
jgi:hypothetical protein